MAVLKSFDLNGNKQSFASWISNLSPCETPFASMIGKRGIDQAQYSWQTDKLAPAIHTGFEEGSLAVSGATNPTEVIHNFTTILRKVVNVSDTAESIALHGRESELSYQMMKAGKELKRDLEFMLLHNVNGRPGLPTAASQFSGFEGLLAGINVADTGTGAVVHKEARVGGDGTRLDKKDIFDLTYNLFLSGSKANKIMFHPKYALSFSDLVNDNPMEPLSWRMFDELDTVFNSQVKKIRDPLGREYTLIPNRNMPVDKIFFFNEDDWTQTILRAPEAKKLGRVGSSDRYMIEMEVGLQHKHPYASGALTVIPANVLNHLTVSENNFTAQVGDELDVHTVVTINGIAEEGLDVYWQTSNPEIASFEFPVSVTQASTGRADNTLMVGNKTGTISVWCVAKGVRSQEYRVHVTAPNTELTVDNLNPITGVNVLFTATVTREDGTPVPAGAVVEWYLNPSANVSLTNTKSTTDDLGVATMEGHVDVQAETLVQCHIGLYNSNKIYLNYVPKVGLIQEPVITPDTLGVGQTVSVTTDVFDETGAPFPGQVITWNLAPHDIGGFSAVTSVTDVNGTATTTFTGAKKGQGVISASTYGGEVSRATPLYVGVGANMDFTINPNPTLVGEHTKFTVVMTGQDGSPLRDLPITFATNPAIQPPIPGGTTDINGICEVEVSPLFAANMQVTATCVGFDVSESVDFVVKGGGFNKPYVHTVSGHTGLHTHSTNIAKVITINTKLWSYPEVGVRIECFSLTPEFGVATPQNNASTLEGDSFIDIIGTGHGIAKFAARAVGNTDNMIEFSVDVRSPSLEVIVTPTTQTAGKDVEFSAAYRDANDNWIPGMDIEWVYPPLMLANATTLPTVPTDQFGRVHHTRKAGVWGTHTLHARVANHPNIKSRNHTLTSVL